VFIYVTRILELDFSVTAVMHCGMQSLLFRLKCWRREGQFDMFPVLLFLHCIVYKAKVKLSLHLTNTALRHEHVWGNGCIDLRFLDLCTSWKWMISFTPRPLYPRRKSPRHPLDRRPAGPQNRSGRHGEEKNPAPNWTRIPTPRPSNP
jgi:hypothetical protein